MPTRRSSDGATTNRFGQKGTVQMNPKPQAVVIEEENQMKEETAKEVLQNLEEEKALEEEKRAEAARKKASEESRRKEKEEAQKKAREKDQKRKALFDDEETDRGVRKSCYIYKVNNDAIEDILEREKGHSRKVNYNKVLNKVIEEGLKSLGY